MPEDVELARWRGKAETTLDDHERRLGAINGHIQELTRAVGDLRTSASRFAVMFALAVGLASILGSAIGMIIVYELTQGA